MRDLVREALAIEELAQVLHNISHDDKKPIEAYTDAEILHEAKYVLRMFTDPSEGHINHEAYSGEEGAKQKKWAAEQVAALRRFTSRNE